MEESADDRINPFEPPQSAPARNLGPPVFRRGRAGAYLTRVVVWNLGANLMGLLEYSALVGLLLAGIGIMLVLPEQFRAPLGVPFIVIGPIGVVAFDIWWRIGQPEASCWVRLFSPSTGGCILFLPVWLAQILSAVAMAATAVYQLRSFS